MVHVLPPGAKNEIEAKNVWAPHREIIRERLQKERGKIPIFLYEGKISQIKMMKRRAPIRHNPKASYYHFSA